MFAKTKIDSRVISIPCGGVGDIYVGIGRGLVTPWIRVQQIKVTSLFFKLQHTYICTCLHLFLTKI